MRVTFVTPLAGLLGGLRVIAIYADLLRRRGHDICVIAVKKRRRTLRQKLRSWAHGRGWSGPDVSKNSWFASLDIDYRVVDDYHLSESEVPDADVVVATWWETADGVVELPQEKGAKAYFVQDYGANPGQPIDEVARTWRLPMHKITISRWLLELIGEHSNDHDIDYVPDSVDQKLFHAPTRGKQSRPTIGFMYSSRVQKGTEIILSAVQHARENIPELEVYAYGSCEPVADLPLPSRTHYRCRAPDADLCEIYSHCDAWLFGSTKEGFGLPVLEAMACRTPVIAVPSGAAPELLADGGGFLVCPDDPQDMSGAIERIAELTDAQWRTISDAAYRTATQYTWNDAADRFEAGLRAAVEPRHAVVSATA